MRTSDKMAALTVVGVEPAHGPLAGHNRVTVDGAGFSSGALVDFGGVPADVVAAQATRITVAVPPGTVAGGVRVRVRNPDGAMAALDDGYSYDAPPGPRIDAVSPSRGPLAGGARVDISGDGFAPGVRVRFGVTEADGVVVRDATNLSATAPPAAAPGVVSVSVQGDDGRVAMLAGGYRYDAPTVEVPAIASVAPARGPLAGGTLVTLDGRHFAVGVRVRFGDRVATAVRLVSPERLDATTPPGRSAGPVDVRVTNPDGQSAVRADGFRYDPSAMKAAPTLVEVTPPSGPVGSLVAIGGTGFHNGCRVRFGGALASSVTGLSPNLVNAIVPAGVAVGAVTVEVENPDGQVASQAQAFRVESGAPDSGPVVTSVAPDHGALAGANVVTVAGRNFAPGTVARFGAVDAKTTVIHAQLLAAVAPRQATPGLVPVRVVNPDGQSATLPSAYQYDQPQRLPSPAIRAVTPARGPSSGGTSVVVTGTNFVGGCRIRLGGQDVGAVTFVDPTRIVIVTPPATPGRVALRILSRDGQTAIVDPAFTYE